jgi:hypothetical protein
MRSDAERSAGRGACPQTDAGAKSALDPTASADAHRVTYHHPITTSTSTWAARAEVVARYS